MTSLKHVLLVEDEEDHAGLILRVLKKNGKLLNKIIWHNNGQKALDYIFREGAYADREDTGLPELILLDLKMPIKNGFEVLQELKAREKYKNIPVVVLTTSNHKGDIEKALSLGANDYIVKPVGFKDFMAKINDLGYYWGVVSNAKGRS